ncbi:hypothetical protein PCE1_003393 [Barthelona sp. PCE]
MRLILVLLVLSLALCDENIVQLDDNIPQLFSGYYTCFSINMTREGSLFVSMTGDSDFIMYFSQVQFPSDFENMAYTHDKEIYFPYHTTYWLQNVSVVYIGVQYLNYEGSPSGNITAIGTYAAVNGAPINDHGTPMHTDGYFCFRFLPIAFYDSINVLLGKVNMKSSVLLGQTAGRPISAEDIIWRSDYQKGRGFNISLPDVFNPHKLLFFCVGAHSGVNITVYQPGYMIETIENIFEKAIIPEHQWQFFTTTLSPNTDRLFAIEIIECPASMYVFMMYKDGYPSFENAQQMLHTNHFEVISLMVTRSETQFSLGLFNPTKAFCRLKFGIVDDASYFLNDMFELRPLFMGGVSKILFHVTLDAYLEYPDYFTVAASNTSNFWVSTKYTDPQMHCEYYAENATAIEMPMEQLLESFIIVVVKPSDDRTPSIRGGLVRRIHLHQPITLLLFHRYAYWYIPAIELDSDIVLSFLTHDKLTPEVFANQEQLPGPDYARWSSELQSQCASHFEIKQDELEPHSNLYFSFNHYELTFTATKTMSIMLDPKTPFTKTMHVGDEAFVQFLTIKDALKSDYGFTLDVLSRNSTKAHVLALFSVTNRIPTLEDFDWALADFQLENVAGGGSSVETGGNLLFIRYDEVVERMAGNQHINIDEVHFFIRVMIVEVDEAGNILLTKSWDTISLSINTFIIPTLRPKLRLSFLDKMPDSPDNVIQKQVRHLVRYNIRTKMLDPLLLIHTDCPDSHPVSLLTSGSGKPSLKHYDQVYRPISWNNTGGDFGLWKTIPLKDTQVNSIGNVFLLINNPVKCNVYMRLMVNQILPRSVKKRQMFFSGVIYSYSMKIATFTESLNLFATLHSEVGGIGDCKMKALVSVSNHQPYPPFAAANSIPSPTTKTYQWDFVSEGSLMNILVDRTTPSEPSNSFRVGNFFVSLYTTCDLEAKLLLDIRPSGLTDYGFFAVILTLCIFIVFVTYHRSLRGSSKNANVLEYHGIE